MLLKFEAEDKSLRPRTKGPEAKTEVETRGYEFQCTSVPVYYWFNF